MPDSLAHLCKNAPAEAIFAQKPRNRTKNALFNHFFLQNICTIRKNVVPLHRSPGNSSPRYDAGDESGFFVSVCLMVAKVQKIFQIADDYAKFLRERRKNKERELIAEDFGTGFPLLFLSR